MAQAAAIPYIIAAIGTAVSAYGAVESSNAQAAAAKFNADTASQNAGIANQNAAMAAQAGEQQAAVQQQKTRAEVGAIKSAQAASNVDVNSGSAVDVRSSASELGELNALTVRSNAAKQAYGYQTQATGYQNEAALNTYQGQADVQAGQIGASGTLLSGLSSAGMNYSNWAAGNGLATGGSLSSNMSSFNQQYGLGLPSNGGF